MSEVDDLKKALSTAMSRIAALESRPTAPAPAQFDTQGFVRDPIGSMRAHNMPVDHIARVMVAHVMGDQAPPELRALAAMGPQVSQQQALTSELGQLRQRLEQIETERQLAAVRQSFSTLAGDKSKYPTLAAAYARNPGAFEADVASYKGDAAALADSLEGKLKALAPAVGAPQPASTVNAGQATSQSSQTQQAQGSAVTGGPVDTTPPPLPSIAKPGVFTQTDHEALKARIIQKHAGKSE